MDTEQNLTKNHNTLKANLKKDLAAYKKLVNLKKNIQMRIEKTVKQLEELKEPIETEKDIYKSIQIECEKNQINQIQISEEKIKSNHKPSKEIKQDELKSKIETMESMNNELFEFIAERIERNSKIPVSFKLNFFYFFHVFKSENINLIKI